MMENVITDEALKQGEIVTGTNGKVGMAYYDEVNNKQLDGLIKRFQMLILANGTQQ